jgi:hypothetical protein
MRVRFALAGWPPPRRLALARLTRSDRAWKPADVWYPGQMITRSRRSERESRGAILSLTSTPVGRTALLAEALAVAWDPDLARATVSSTASGDTAAVEVALDVSPGHS